MRPGFGVGQDDEHLGGVGLADEVGDAQRRKAGLPCAEQFAGAAQLQVALTDTVWNAGGCRSWYRDAQGRNLTLWPTHTMTFLRQMRRFDADAYELRTARRAAVPVA